jgi:purine-binding chemotaxis protein CheW
MTETPVVERTAADLRHAFDQSFAGSPARAREEVDDLLTIRVAGDRYAIHLRDIAGMIAGPRVIPVPSATLDLLGLAGIRGGVVPVFGLASILGYGPAAGSPRWMVLCGAEEPIALAFSDFEGYLQLPQSSLQADENLRATRPYIDQIASTTAGVCAVISIPLIVAAIRNRSGPRRLAKEQ